MADKTKFLQAYELDVNKKTEKKKDLTYLSWAWAWAEFVKIYPEATYEVVKFTNEKGVKAPYTYDENTGYMVFTKVKADEKELEMWLPVMDYNNNAMKSIKYKTTDKYPKDVNPATMFDVNKATMRCLTKNLAMFGLGLYIYAGEDLPEVEPTKITNKEVEEFLKTCGDVDELISFYNLISKDQQNKFKQNFTNVKNGLNDDDIPNSDAIDFIENNENT